MTSVEEEPQLILKLGGGAEGKLDRLSVKEEAGCWQPQEKT